MTVRPLRGRIGICARCHVDRRRIVARHLCNNCYVTEQRGRRLERWPLMGHDRKPVLRLPPVDPNAPAAPGLLSCGWCATPLTRSRVAGGALLFEVFTVAGRLVALCFENCLELAEVT